MLDLKRPHGYLMSKGKKRAVLRPHGDPLLIGEELEVVTGDESFGVAVLGPPMKMLASEVDRKEYFEGHRVRPDERESWWPGETRFLVYPVESFEKAGSKPQSFEDLKGYTGAMIAFFLPLQIARNLVLDIEGALPPEELHLTLAFLGDSRELKGRDVVERIAAKLASETPPMKGSIQGFGVFEGTQDGDVLYASFDAPALPGFRQELAERLEAVGIEPSKDHGFTPHITLAYLPVGAEIPTLRGIGQDVTFTELTSSWGEKRTDYRLTGQEAKKEGEMPYEKFKDGDRWCVRKETGKLMHCYSGDGAEGKADRYLAALRTNVEAGEKVLDPEWFDVPESPPDEKAKPPMVECPECGKPYPEGTEECPHCGAKVEAEKAGDIDEREEGEGEAEKGRLKKLMQEVDALRDENAMLSASLEKAAPKKTVDGEEYPASAFLVVGEPDKPSTWHLRVRDGDGEADHRLMGAAWAALHGGYRGNEYEGPDRDEALRKLKALYEEEGMDVPGEKARDLAETSGEAEQDDKAGRRVKKSVMDRLRTAWDALGEALRFAQYEDEEPEPTMAELFKASPDVGFMVKQVRGEPWLVTWSSNAFKDRDDEMFTTRGLERYVQENEQKDERGWFNFWHVPGTDFARKEWQGVVGDTGGILMEAGPFLDNELGRKAARFFTKFPTGHPKIAPEGWGCSVEYRYLPEEKKAGVYERFWVTRTSILPRLSAANTWTKGGITMALTKKQREGLEAIFPDDAEAIVQGAEDQAEQLKEQGVEHKEASEEKAMDAGAVAKAINKLAEGADEALAAKLVALAKALEEDEPAEDEEEEKEASEPEPVVIDLELLGKEIAKQFDVQLQPLAEMQKMLEAQAEKMGELEAAVAKYKRAEKTRRDEETPRFVLSLETKASEAEETALDESDPLLKMKPAETKPASGSGADHFFGSRK